jgi:hypothetical protein
MLISQCRLETVASSKQKSFAGSRQSRIASGGTSIVCAARDPDLMINCGMTPSLAVHC